MATLGEYNGAGSGTTKLLLHLNGNSNDSSGNSNNGTDTAITYSQANGKFGQGAGFNGSSSLITVGSNFGIAGNGDITLSGWFKINSTPTTNIEVFFIHATTLTSTRYIQVYYQKAGGTTLQLQLDASGTGALNYAVDLGTTNWYHILITRNSTTASLYLNGKLVTSGAIGTGSGYSANLLNIGIDNTSTNWFNGSIDEVIIENIAWTPEQVKKYYTYTRAMFGII